MKSRPRAGSFCFVGRRRAPEMTAPAFEMRSRAGRMCRRHFESSGGQFESSRRHSKMTARSFRKQPRSFGNDGANISKAAAVISKWSGSHFEWSGGHFEWSGSHFEGSRGHSRSTPRALKARGCSPPTHERSRERHLRPAPCAQRPRGLDPRLRARNRGDDADAEQRQAADGDVERLGVHEVGDDGQGGNQDHPAEHGKIEPVHSSVLSNTGARQKKARRAAGLSCAAGVLRVRRSSSGRR
jgi:hypothetical protein